MKRKSKHLHLLLLFSLIILVKFSTGQNINDVTIKYPASIPTPNVSALGNFGQIPVDYQTGIPDISIPLYTVSSKTLQVPISVKYHASGIKPNLYPGWVGLNWALQAGGEINRIVCAIPDEADEVPAGNTSGTGDNLGYYFIGIGT